MRITAQRIDVATGSHLWSQNYEREWHDIFDIQAEITRAVASSLARQLRLEPTQVHPQPDPDAHRLYLKGRHRYHKWTVEDVNQALWAYSDRTTRPRWGGGLLLTVVSGVPRGGRQMILKYHSQTADKLAYFS